MQYCVSRIGNSKILCATIQLENVRHVLDIRFNLILVKAMDIKGYQTYFGGGRICKITKDPYW